MQIKELVSERPCKSKNWYRSDHANQKIGLGAPMQIKKLARGTHANQRIGLGRCGIYARNRFNVLHNYVIEILYWESINDCCIQKRRLQLPDLRRVTKTAVYGSELGLRKMANANTDTRLVCFNLSITHTSRSQHSHTGQNIQRVATAMVGFYWCQSRAV